jgi:hypothetical protein
LIAEGIQAFYHALAHIEFVAIYLAWDILYRFRGLPEDFYQDWLQVAQEEALHFTLIREHLRKLGIDYGDHIFTPASAFSMRIFSIIPGVTAKPLASIHRGIIASRASKSSAVS